MGEEISVAAKLPKGIVGKALPYLLALLLGAGGLGVGQALAPTGQTQDQAQTMDRRVQEQVEAVDHEARARVGVLEATMREQNAAVMRELAGVREDIKELARAARRPVR
jgi:hypothetical protein